MSDEEVDELGPVDYIGSRLMKRITGRMADELRALTEGGVSRVLDLLFLNKCADGPIEGFEAHDFEDTDSGPGGSARG